MSVPKLRFPEFDGEWKFCRLSEVIDFKSGYAFPSFEMSSEVKKYQIIKMSNVYKNTLLLTKNPSYWDRLTQAQQAFVLKKDDVILTLTGTVGKRDYGYSIIISENDKFLLNQRLVRLRAKDGWASPEFVRNLVLYERFLHKFFFSSKGGTGNQSNVGVFDLENMRMPVPSLPEQQKIASFLSAVDKKIDLLRQKKSVLELYKKGLMQKIFSQEIRFKRDDGSDFPDWEEVALGDVIKEIGDGGTPDTKNPDYFGGKIPWVVIEDISEKIEKTKTTITELGLRKSSAKIWPKGSLILSTGATIGRVGIAQTDVTTKQGICGIILNEGVNYKFIFYVLTWSSPWFLRMAQGNTIKEVRASTVKKMTFGLPSGEEQKKIASFLSAIDSKIQKTSAQIEQMETFKKGLLQQMFV